MTGPAEDRALGALLGLAVGDALGMATETLTRAEVVDRFGDLVDRPHAARGLPAGSVTDDTEQALLLGRLLVAGQGRVDPGGWAQALLGWERDLAARGRADLLGPSTRRALDAVLAGVPPEQAGASGDTNGAAMRIAPAGIAFPPGSGLVDTVLGVSRVTHGSAPALGGAVAVAVAVSAGVAGASVAQALRAADEAAGFSLLGRAIAAGERWRGVPPPRLVDQVLASFGAGLPAAEAVPAAFAVAAACADDPWLAVRVAASLGDDSDTVAAMVGAMTGACHGARPWPADVRGQVERVNGLDLAPLARALLALRGAG